MNYRTTRKIIFIMILFFIFSFLLISSFSQISYGYIKEIRVDKDASVYDNTPDTNYGNDTYLRVGNYNFGKARTYYHFNVSSLPKGWSEATVVVYFDYGSSMVHVGGNLTYDCWDEMTITWNNKPSAGRYRGHIYCDGFDFNIPLEPENFIDGGVTICLYGKGGESDGFIQGDSREGAPSKGQTPFVRLTYDDDPTLIFIVLAISLLMVVIIILISYLIVKGSSFKRKKKPHGLFPDILDYNYREKPSSLKKSIDKYDMLKNVHVPLNYSNLQEFISEREVIIYSTLCKVILKGDMGFTVTPKAWFTHLLITENGLYYGQYDKRSRPRISYLDWRNIKKIKKAKIFRNKEHIFKLFREPNFEFKESFKKREKEFSAIIEPIMKKRQNIGIDELKSMSDDLGSVSSGIGIRNPDRYGINSKFESSEDFSYMRSFLGKLDIFERYGFGNRFFGLNAYYEDIRLYRMTNQLRVRNVFISLGIWFISTTIGLIFWAQIPNTYEYSLILALIPSIVFIPSFHLYIRVKRILRNFKLKEDLTHPDSIKLYWYSKILKKPLNLDDRAEGFKKLQILGFIRKGSDAFQKRNYKEAVEIFQQIVENEPYLEINWYALLESLSYLGKWEEIIDSAGEAIKINPNYGPYYVWLGEAHSKLNEKELSTYYYKKGLKLLENDFYRYIRDDNILNMMGLIHIKLGNFKEGIKYNREALRLKPTSEHHLHNIGLAYKEMEKYKKAVRYFKKSLKYNPKHSYAWFDLGEIYEGLHKAEKALDCYEKAVEYSPQWVKLREKLISIEPNSPALKKALPEIELKREKQKNDGYDLYDTLHTKKRDNKIKIYEDNLRSLLRKNEEEWIVYLEESIDTYTRRLQILKINPRVPPFLINRMKVQKKYKKNLLKNLIADPEYIYELRTIIENDIELYKWRIGIKDQSREKNLEIIFKILLKMPLVQLIFFLKEDVIMKQEILDHKIMDDKEREARKMGLNFAKDTLMNLNNDPNYIHFFRNQIDAGLKAIENRTFFDMDNGLFNIF
ncbi:MAG: tetratricopeptide repeat protein [Candidatus Hodarchaeota archaeon]